MTEDASIRMTVDSSQAISEQQKYLRAATENFNVLQQKSESYGKSLQQRIKFMERELELQKENTRISTQKELRGIETRFEKGEISKEVRKRSIEETKRNEKEDLSELSETNKLLRSWVQEQKEIARRSEKLTESLRRSFSTVLGADSPTGMAQGGLRMMSGSTGVLGLAGLALGLVVGKSLRGAMTMEPSMRDYAILTGRDLVGTREEVRATKDMGLGKMGLTPSQYFTQYSQHLRAAGGVSNDKMINILGAEKALGIGIQETGHLMGLERYGKGEIIPILTFFERYLKDTNQSIAVLPEILQTFSTEASAMLRTTGKVDSESIASMVSAVSKAYNLQGEPLQQVMGSLRQGLQQSSNPVIQALQFSTLDRVMPGKSLWQMEMAMENPLGNKEYLTSFLKQLRQVSGGGEMYARTLYNVFGQYGITRNIANQMAMGDVTEEDFLRETDKFGKKTDYRKRAEGVTGALEEANARWQGTWERTGFTQAEGLVTELTNALDGLSGKMDKINDTINEWGVKMAAQGVESKTQFGQFMKTMLAHFALTGKF
jgi:hypothetical protein